MSLYIIQACRHGGFNYVMTFAYKYCRHYTWLVHACPNGSVGIFDGINGSIFEVVASGISRQPDCIILLLHKWIIYVAVHQVAPPTIVIMHKIHSKIRNIFAADLGLHGWASYIAIMCQMWLPWFHLAFLWYPFLNMHFDMYTWVWFEVSG